MNRAKQVLVLKTTPIQKMENIIVIITTTNISLNSVRHCENDQAYTVYLA